MRQDRRREEKAARPKRAIAAIHLPLDHGEDAEALAGFTRTRRLHAPALHPKMLALDQHALCAMARDGRLHVIEIDRGERLLDVELARPAIEPVAVPIEDAI